MDAPAPHELFVSSAERAPLSGRGFWPTPLRPDFIIRPAVLDLLPGSVEIAAGGVQRLPGPPISQDAYLRCCCCALHRSELRIENPGDLVAGAFQMHARGAVRSPGESGGDRSAQRAQFGAVERLLVSAGSEYRHGEPGRQPDGERNGGSIELRIHQVEIVALQLPPVGVDGRLRVFDLAPDA